MERLTVAASAWDNDPAHLKLTDAIRKIGERHKRLTSLREMPMRTTEAQEIQHFLESAGHDLKEASQDLKRAVHEATQPLRTVLEQHAMLMNGKLQFPYENDLLDLSLRPRVEVVGPTPSVLARIRDEVFRILRVR